MTVELESVEETDEFRWRDELDAVGPRCGDPHPDIGRCIRRYDHETRGDAWHYAVTNYDQATRQRQLWRWRDA